MIGTTIAHYQITEKIGQGGMGEVYRASDSKLNRDVALKILPEEFASDAQRMGRFQREAQVLASLSHPNIGSIYGIEDAGETKALVLELINGPTLADRIGQRPIPVDEALKIALQIAEGLEAAHEKGIIHRDLKPANIKITPEGQVKILDFGLAKAMEGDPASPDMSQSPTLSMQATQAGVILGTAAYMSPEQARGKPVDRRSDNWAFGCVFYEMLTGKGAFGGEDVSDTLASVLAREPDWEGLPTGLPWRVRELIGACLERNARARIQHIGDARIQIKKALEESSERAFPGQASDTTQTSLWRRAIPWSLAGLIAILAVFGPWYPGSSELRPVRRFAVDLGPAVPVRNNGLNIQPALSPDGNRLVYATRIDGSTKLLTRRIDQLETQPLHGTEGADRPFFSSDGEWIAFFTPGSDRKLKRMSLTGGEPQVLADVTQNSGGTWASDNTIVFSARDDSGVRRLFRVAATGGSPQTLTSPKGERGEIEHTWPEILPGSSSILFTIRMGGLTTNIALLSLETGEYRTLFEGGYNAHYVPTGHLVFGRQNELWGVPFDLRRLEIAGREIPILRGIQVDSRRDSLAIAFSSQGLLVYVPGEDVSGGPNRSLLWVDRQGLEEPLAVEPRRYSRPQVSPDGSRLAIAITDSGDSDIWIYDLADERFSRLTFDPANDQLPVWSSNGSRVLFSSNRDGEATNLFWKAADGTGQVERLTTSLNDQFAHSYSPDGNLLYCGGPRTPFDLGLLSMEGPSTAQLLTQTESNDVVPMISPDGHWVAYLSNESGRFEVYVRPFPDLAGGRWQISNGRAGPPVWAPDGNELFYRGDGAMMVVEIQTEPTFVAGTPKILFTDRYFTGDFSYFDISRDGQRFLLMEEVSTEETSTQMVFVENWFEELSRLVPTN